MSHPHDETETESPFDRYDIDPSAGPQAITERFRELVAEAPEAERDALRAAWDRLTLHPEERLRAVFLAHPETRPPIGAAPRRRRAPPAAPAADEPHASWLGLLVLPSLTALLAGEPRASVARLGGVAHPPRASWLSADPVLSEKE
ncbi:MAG: hypothetical protein IPQ09_29060 [Myxococcales bacterium]|nr:hypothetical protein [Myxococcales bacterium]HQY62642.1 hypothetical protein [Polyangiaceae bacterium]